jgi:polar amino acid transport system substrate-binding protein
MVCGRASTISGYSDLLTAHPGNRSRVLICCGDNFSAKQNKTYARGNTVMRATFTACAGLVVATFLAIAPVLPAQAQAKVPGVAFTGGDGSYDRAVKDGIILGIGIDPPYSYFDQTTQKNDGMDVRIFEEVTKRLGITKVQWQLVPFDALIPGLISKRWDVVAENIHENEKRLAVISFTSPAYWYGSSFAVQKGNPLNIHTYAQLAGHTVGSLRGDMNNSILASRKEIKELKLYTTDESMFADLASGRVDVVINDEIKIANFIKAHPAVSMEKATGYEPQQWELGYARYGVRKDEVDLNWAISRAIDEMRADGTVGKIISDYGFGLNNLWNFPMR